MAPFLKSRRSEKTEFDYGRGQGEAIGQKFI